MHPVCSKEQPRILLGSAVLSEPLLVFVFWFYLSNKGNFIKRTVLHIDSIYWSHMPSVNRRLQTMEGLQFTCAALMILSYVGTGFAADIIVLPSESGKVIFTHKKHQEAIKDCEVCHKTALGTIKEFGQDRPHKLCIGCHEKKKSGPIDCVGCHETSCS
jgi:predicted CXXCH cytochrome family protein